MEEEQKEQPTPVRSRLKLYKILTVTLFFIVLFFLAGGVTVETTSSSKFCSSCHEMSPEYYTWKASSHNQVGCKNCHIQSGVVNYAKAKANGLVQVYEKATNHYTAPIQMPTQIPDATCEKCHNMKNRQVTPSGDLIIPHDKHLTKGIKCVQCHSGVAHGDISDRNVTFKSDYDKWDASLGKAMMSDVKFTRPQMETCIECHKARDVSTACKTCHQKGMTPKSHLDPNFKKGKHGPLAEKDVRYCNSCHQYMSSTDIKELKAAPAALQFLTNGKIKDQSITAQEYAKENTFCKNCHSTRPASHTGDYVNLHGPLAKTNKLKCLTCHDEQNTGNNQTAAPTCSSCHPASHKGKNWQIAHPANIQVKGVKRPTELCYTCHYRPVCSSCHKAPQSKTHLKIN